MNVKNVLPVPDVGEWQCLHGGVHHIRHFLQPIPVGHPIVQFQRDDLGVFQPAQIAVCGKDPRLCAFNINLCASERR